MKIKAISDSHKEHSTLELGSGDILISAGDVGMKGNYTEGLSFLYWFVKQPYKYKILVPGNHDRALRNHPELSKLAYDMGIIILNNDYIEIEGLKIYGVSNTFSDEDRDIQFCVTKSMRKNAWKDIPEGLDILITHIPPKFILDINLEGMHIGCSQLTEKVKIAKPKLHLFGHVHEERDKVLNLYGTKFMNVAVMSREYLITHYQGYDITI